MALTIFQKALVAVGGLLALILIHVVMVTSVNHQAKAIILRAEFVLVMETILTLFSVMIWRTFSPYLKSDSGSSHYSATPTMNGAELSRPPLRKTSDVDLQAHNVQSSSGKQRWSLMQVLLLAYIFICQTSYLTNIYFIAKEPHWYGMLAYACLGTYIQLVTSLGIGHALSFIISLFRQRVPNRSRPGLEKRTVAFMAVFYTLLASMYGLHTASQPPSIRNVKIPVKDLPSNLEGLKIVQISDIHLGPTVGFSKLNMIVDIVNSQQPDLVVLTGDLVDGGVASLRTAAEPLSRVISKYGNFFVSGNHEYYTGDVDNWFSYLRSLGFTVLHNSNVNIPAKVSKDQGQLCVAGTDDIQADTIGYAGHRFDVAAATKSCAQDRPVILLAHQPRAAKRALDSNHRVDLVLSGHTHGGQVFPLMLGAYFMNPFYVGLYQYGPSGSHVYVCEGTQYWGIPMRIGTSTEIARITLTKAAL